MIAMCVCVCVYLWTMKNGNANKDENAAKKQKVIILEVKFKSNIKGVMEEIANYRNADTTPIQLALNVQSEDL